MKTRPKEMAELMTWTSHMLYSKEMDESPKEKRWWPCNIAPILHSLWKSAAESKVCKKCFGIHTLLQNICISWTPWLTGMHIKEKGKCRQFEEKIEKQQRRQKSCYCPHKWLTDVS